MKALLKEGDLKSAMRVLEEGEKSQEEKLRHLDNHYLNVYSKFFDRAQPKEEKVEFLPELLQEFQNKIKDEVAKAGEVSQYAKKVLIEKYQNFDLKPFHPVSFSDFKKKHYQMTKAMQSCTQQMLIQKTIKSCVEDSDYDNINSLFDYLMVVREEEMLREAIKGKIEEYKEKYYKAETAKGKEEMEDPMRVLFDYFYTSQSTPSSLVSAYILISPAAKSHFEKLQTRKQTLYSKISSIVSEKDAIFLAKNTDPQREFLGNQMASLGLEIDSEKARKAFEKVVEEYEKVMNYVDNPNNNYVLKTEAKFELTPEQIKKARLIRADNPKADYIEIIKKVKENYGSSFEDNPENILADLDSITSENQLVDKFFNAFKNDELSTVSRVDIERLLKPSLISAFRKYNKDYKSTSMSKLLNSSKTASQILDQQLSDYFDLSVSSRPGFTTFINHATGNVVEVNDKKFATDKKYFTEVVAELAKVEIANSQWAQQTKHTAEKKVIDGLMRSREFRKFYYFTRKFYFQKIENMIEEGRVEFDEFGNLIFSEDKSKTKISRHKDDVEQDDSSSNPKLRHINSVFQPPRFDILDFKQYFPKDEYNSLVKEFYDYTRGDSNTSKAQFIQRKILGEKVEDEIKSKVSNTLRSLFQKVGLQVSKDVQPSKLFGPIVTEDLAGLSSTSQNQKSVRQKTLDSRFKSEMLEKWKEYKAHKLSEHVQGGIPRTIDITQSEDWYRMNKDKFEEVMNQFRETDLLINFEKNDSTFKPSRDHLAFEFFEKVVDLNGYVYGKDENERDLEIYGNDGFDNGYKNSIDMAQNFEDLYDLDDPDYKKGMRFSNYKTFEDASIAGTKSRLKKKDKETPQKEVLEHDYFTPNTTEVPETIDFNQEYQSKLSNWNFKEMNLDEERDFFTLDEDKSNLKDFQSPAQRYMRHEELYLPGRVDDPNDEYNVRERFYNESIDSLKDRLQSLIVEKKQEAVDVAMKIFNRIQSVKLSHSFTLNSKEIDYDVLNKGIFEREHKAKKIQKEFLGTEEPNLDDLELFEGKSAGQIVRDIQVLKSSLDDQTSPSLSYIKEMHKKGLLGLDNSEVDKVVDTEASDFVELKDNLENIYSELENKEKLMVELQQEYERNLKKLEEQKTSNKDKAAEWNKLAQNELEKKIYDSYIEYQRDLLDKAKTEAIQGSSSQLSEPKYPENVQNGINQSKINIIRSVFGVMETKEISNFGSDLIDFGIAHDIPDAVRLGENIAGLNNEYISNELGERLKKYTMQNASKLRERIQFTGPMKSIIQKRKSFMSSRGTYEPFYTVDYDESMVNKYNAWRLPSIYTVEHTKYGIWSEIFKKPGETWMDAERRLDEFYSNSL